MRSTLGALVLAPLLALAVGCSDGPGDEQDDARPAATRSAETPDTGPDARPDTRACDEVVAGIADFNAGDYAGTVEHFEAAVPLAEAEAAADPGPEAEALLEAVRYYAELAPDDYGPASLSSPDFATYKAITLGQCASGTPATPAPTDEGLQA